MIVLLCLCRTDPFFGRYFRAKEDLVGAEKPTAGKQPEKGKAEDGANGTTEDCCFPPNIEVSAVLEGCQSKSIPVNPSDSSSKGRYM